MSGTTHKKNLVIITGPTASGKTALGIALAQHFNTAIISADSRQCYRELKIGVARPSMEELAAVPHYFISSHSISEEISAADFEAFALATCETLFQHHDTVIMVGGTGLYIRAFMEGFDAIPEIDPSLRASITAQYREKGIAWLKQELETKDPLFAARGEMQNPQRMMRALEVREATGQSILSYRKAEKKVRPFGIIQIGLELPREELRSRINARVDEMMKQGLLEEVRSMMPWRDKNALKTVGYAELFDYLDGHCTLEEAVDRIKVHTRQYAKRQMTWFKKDGTIQWFHPNQFSAMLAYIKSRLA